MVKTKLGERLRSKAQTAQVNEVLCKTACHNLCCLIQSIYELEMGIRDYLAAPGSGASN